MFQFQSGILCSSKSSGFTLRLEQSKDVALLDWSLDVSDESSLLAANEFDLDLGDTTTGAYRRGREF